MNSLQTVKEAFAWSQQELPSGCELEVYYSAGRGRSVVW